jgi:hypothetical protein
MGVGFLAFLDEFRYEQSWLLLQNILDLEFKAAVKSVFSAHGRPGDVVIKTIPAALQFASAKLMGIDYFGSNNSYPLFLFNFIVYCFNLVIIYRLALQLIGNNTTALFSVLLFSSLTNSHLYLRHALPYDAGLLILLFSIYLLIKWQKGAALSQQRSFVLGIISCLGCLTYPGYVSLLLASFVFLLCYDATCRVVRFRFVPALYYSSGVIITLLTCEILSRLGDSSYLYSALGLSVSVTQGSFEECFVFLFKYLIEVEKMTGGVLILGLLGFGSIAARSLATRKHSDDSSVICLGVSLAGTYIIYAAAGYFFETAVFYGRLIHQYLPFICIFTAFVAQKILLDLRIGHAVIFATSALCIANFIISLNSYSLFSYPRDIGWEVLNRFPSHQVDAVCEYANGWSVIPASDSRKTRRVDPDMVMAHSQTVLCVNCCVFFPLDDFTKYREFRGASDLRLLESAPHFQGFKGYQYEGQNIAQREYLDKLDLKIKIFTQALS